MKNYSHKYRLLICDCILLLVAISSSAQTQANGYSQQALVIKPVKAHLFSSEYVALLDGPFKTSRDAEAKNIRSLDVDRLLSPFLTEAGLSPKAPAYPGWETGLLPGVGLSFYLSGICRLYMATGEKDYAQRIDYILGELERCQENTGGYLLGVKGGRQIFARVEKEGFFPGFGAWGGGSATPHYSLEKLFSGLRDVYRITHKDKALRIAINLADWLERDMSHLSDAELSKFMKIEYGGMNWVLADLYADTGDKRYLAMSKRWQDTITMLPLMQGRDVLTGVHGNMQFPKFSGLAARYPYTGDQQELNGARYFWERVANHRTYATGGNTESEFFDQADSLSKTLTPFTEENCNEYNMLRLTALLNEIEPDIKYADYMERTLFNHLLSAQNLSDGRLTYHLPLIPGGEKIFQPLDYFSCCTASGLDSYNRPAEYIYLHGEKSLYVNLFVASRLDFKEKSLVLTQETSFPDKDFSTLHFKVTNPVLLDVCIRNPYWSAKPLGIIINGASYPGKVSEDGYFHINRIWNNRDLVRIQCAMALRTERMPDDKKMVALFYGPILLAAELNRKQSNRLLDLNMAPQLNTTGLTLQGRIKPLASPLSFTTSSVGLGRVNIVPFYKKTTGNYSVYWKKLEVSSNLHGPNREVPSQTLKNKADRSLVDQVIIGNNLSETQHGLIGGGTLGYGNEGIYMDRCWRSSYSGAIGYILKVDQDRPMVLKCQFMGRSSYETWDCRLTIDGTTIHKFSSAKDDSRTTRIWDAVYHIPAALSKGKKAIRVMFEKNEERNVEMPRVMALQTLLLTDK